MFENQNGIFKKFTGIFRVYRMLLYPWAKLVFYFLLHFDSSFTLFFQINRTSWKYLGFFILTAYWVILIIFQQIVIRKHTSRGLLFQNRSFCSKNIWFLAQKKVSQDEIPLLSVLVYAQFTVAHSYYFIFWEFYNHFLIIYKLLLRFICDFNTLGCLLIILFIYMSYHESLLSRLWFIYKNYSLPIE